MLILNFTETTFLDIFVIIISQLIDNILMCCLGNETNWAQVNAAIVYSYDYITKMLSCTVLMYTDYVLLITYIYLI